MSSFGENLRREREMRGISLEEISATTKISVRFLEALENDDFGNLPGGIFTRGFIRSYAKYLGMDEEHVITEYQLLVQPKADIEIPRAALGRLGTSRPTKRNPTLPLLIAFVLLIGGYALFRYSHRSTEPGAFSNPINTMTNSASAKAETGSSSPAADQSAPPPAGGLTDSGSASPGAVMSGELGADHGLEVTPGTNQAAGTAAPNRTAGGNVNGSSGNAASAGLPATGAPSAAITQANPVLGQGNLVLQVAATEPTWINVEADGRTEFQRTLKPNEIRTIRANGYFDVTTGNASGLVLTLNGETLPPVGKRGEVKKVHLSANDLKPAAPPGSQAIPQN